MTGFQIYEGSGEWFDLSKKPVERASFSFGGINIPKNGYEIGEKCIGCGKCANVCPAKAIKMKNKLPKIDRSACIHCFCCQEFCPKGAMKVRRTFIARLLNR